ncbi:hypothetical protein POJ06DRAFT_289294 [Lipomyces tetrasporus]|uniref:Uncharacterized protein n=1 Tax=Lipomyces tetrasporus TaxID=54092 RepID=A0AAD7QVN9_9ASCO|nr:uncharacterized protein POJ06DRAFT_289294 [Lipomyces tetrasporus]KAJ8102374.1 hypothetical protein POJ06DRAFT_289294 [Lipomyces tetrasporus]
MVHDDFMNEKKIEVDITAHAIEQQESNGTADEVAHMKIVNLFKAMNKTGDTGDEDPLADQASEFLYKKLLETSLEDNVNFDNEIYDKIQLMVNGPEAYGEDIDNYELDCLLEAVVIRYHSPYPEVRAVTDPFDTDMPVEIIVHTSLVLFG